MRINDYKEKDIEAILDEIREQLNMLAHQDPSNFVITLDYDGYTLLLETDFKIRTVVR